MDITNVSSALQCPAIFRYFFPYAVCKHEDVGQCIGHECHNE